MLNIYRIYYWLATPIAPSHLSKQLKELLKTEKKKRKKKELSKWVQMEEKKKFCYSWMWKTSIILYQTNCSLLTILLFIYSLHYTHIKKNKKKILIASNGIGSGICSTN
jgi:hypothetical protein